ncbi:hypothetical protein NBRC116584_13710 [Hydrogenophaga sp. 5NK40-0174]
MKKTGQPLRARWMAARNSAAALGLSVGAVMGAAAQQVNDLPGGPAVNGLNFQPAASNVAEGLHGLHWIMLALCAVIFVLVFGVMFYSIIKHRKSVGHQAQELPEPLWVELGWTIVPFIIVVIMGMMATKYVVAQKDTTGSDLTIKVVGMQWKWGYEYLKGEGEGINFLSTLDVSHRQLSNSGNLPPTDDYLLKVDNPLVVPVNKKVRIITTANDVIHAWMVPALGVKQDAVPGFVRDNWFMANRTGDFYGQCAELCGKEHAYMPIHVRVLSAEDYSAWVAEQQPEAAQVAEATPAAAAPAEDTSKEWTQDELMAQGEKVYANNCAACHQANGQGAGAIKPLDGSAIVTDADAAKMLQVVLNGAGNGGMPPWTHLSNADIAAVATYAKNNWSNKTGQVVQPAEVVAAR